MNYQQVGTNINLEEGDFLFEKINHDQMLSDETKFNVDLDNSDQPKVENENSSNDLKQY